MKRLNKMEIGLFSILILCTLTFAGCGCPRDDLGEYLDEMKEIFRDKEFAHAEVIECALTTRESRAKYEIIYADYSRTFFSYRCKTYDYVGGLHGFAGVIIGTVDVATGRKLTLHDVVPPDKRAEALTRLKDAVIRKIGADNLQEEVYFTDNFCVMADGLHFIFQPYEVAPYGFRAVEVVIPAYGKYRIHGSE